MRYIKKLTKNAQNQLGDTIVEVLLAIGIAAFAIGISYATAQRSLDKSITAREHNQALNLIENQIADLKLRFQNAPTTPTNSFNSAFASKTHFCLKDTASDPNNAATWNAFMNDGPNGPPAIDKPLALKNAGPYDPGCQNQRPGEGAVYYTDITTSSGGSGVNETLYHITVRWSPVGGGQTSQASINYKLNGSNGLALAASATSPIGSTPPSCSPTGTVLSFSEDDSLNLKLLKSDNTNSPNTSAGYRVQNYDLVTYDSSHQPLQLKTSCTYAVSIISQVLNHLTVPDRTNEQMFTELCTDITSTCTVSQNYSSVSSAPIYRTGLTSDLPHNQDNLNPPATFTFNVASDVQIKNVLMKHCALWQPSVAGFNGTGPAGGTTLNPWATCRSNTNQLAGYIITVTAS